jgi:hypothetical protein
MKLQRTIEKQHAWVTYINPRNGKVKLAACSQCGVLEGGVARSVGCSSTIARVSNMLLRQGWVAHASAA